VDEAAERPSTRRRTSLSDKQQAILEAIQVSLDSRGYPPSMREIGDAVGLSSLSSVTHQLNQLELSGYLRRDPNRPRAMEILIDLPRPEDASLATPSFGDAVMVPLVGRIAAGIPITAEQHIEEVFPLPRSPTTRQFKPWSSAARMRPSSSARSTKSSLSGRVSSRGLPLNVI